MKFVLLVTLLILGFSSFNLFNSKSLAKDKDLTLELDKNNANGSNNIALKKGQKLNLVFKSDKQEGDWDIVSPKDLKHVKLGKIGMSMSATEPGKMHVKKTFPFMSHTKGKEQVHFVLKKNNKKVAEVFVMLSIR